MRATVTLTTVLATGALLASCSVATDSDEDEQGTEALGTPEPGSTVTLVTHGDFTLPQGLVRAFEKDSGLQLEIKKVDEGLPTQLALTKGEPLGDVAFGVDNGSATIPLAEGVFADHRADLPEGAEDYVYPGEGGDRLTPVDHGEVCLNVDKAWYAKHDQEPPETLDDVTEPAYEDQLVVSSATGSTPGMLFLLTTIDAYGDDWQGYWERLMDNGTKVAKSWSDAYYGDFTGGGGKGGRPIVLSYNTSPAYTIDEKTQESTTAALPETCISQVEYAGVLENADNPAGGRVVVEWLVSPEVQAAFPENMFMFPVDSSVELPEDWQAHAEVPEDTHDLDADGLAEDRRQWLTEWRDIISR